MNSGDGRLALCLLGISLANPTINRRAFGLILVPHIAAIRPYAQYDNGAKNKSQRSPLLISPKSREPLLEWYPEP